MHEDLPKTPGGEYADIVASILDRDAELRRRATRPTEPSGVSLGSWPLVLVLAFVFTWVWGRALAELNRPPPPLNPAEAELGERVKTFAAAHEIHRFQEEHGRLPTSLAEVGLEDTGLHLVVQGDRWRLEETIDGQVVDVGSGEDPMSVIFDMSGAGRAAPEGGGR